MTPRDRDLLEGIVLCVQRVRSYVGRGGAGWAADEMVLDAIAKRLEEIGELAKRLTSETVMGIPDVDWRAIRGMRDVLAHDYGQVQVEIVESVVEDDLRVLDAAVRRSLDA
jgi:uncharacterized protein with HEPN domain